MVLTSVNSSFSSVGLLIEGSAIAADAYVDSSTGETLSVCLLFQIQSE